MVLIKSDDYACCCHCVRFEIGQTKMRMVLALKNVMEHLEKMAICFKCGKTTESEKNSNNNNKNKTYSCIDIN